MTRILIQLNCYSQNRSNTIRQAKDIAPTLTRKMNCLKVIVILNILAVTESAGKCPLDFVIPHGYYTVTTNGTILMFGCEKGFVLYGARSARCSDETWSNQPPHCIANGCSKVESADPMGVDAKYDGAQLTFRCGAGFELVGSNSIHCNGSHWSAPTPICVEKRVSLSCDFEKDDICGWSLDPEGDFDWTWHTGSTPTAGTGPDGDHTLGPKGKGHYLFIETSPPTRNGYVAILSSPFYMPDKSDQCFSFWYHSFGSGQLSQLDVFIWKEGEDKEHLTSQFTLDYITGREWQNKILYIPKQNKPFKIIFLGTRGMGHKHDIAIDDISLGLCPENMTRHAMVSTTTTKMTTTINLQATVEDETSKQTNASTRKNVTTFMTSPVSTQISAFHISDFSELSSQHAKKVTSIKVDLTSKMDISSRKSDLDLHDIKPGLNQGRGAAAVKNDEKGSVDERKMDTMVVYITVGVVAMVVVIAIVSTVCYITQRRRRAKFTTQEMQLVHNPVYDVNLDHERE